jgi:UPF0042 nucleotide-binding protein
MPFRGIPNVFVGGTLPNVAGTTQDVASTLIPRPAILDS